MFEIPGYPTICRVCLARIGAADSVPLEMAVRDGADNYGTILDRVLSQQRTDQVWPLLLESREVLGISDEFLFNFRALITVNFRPTFAVHAAIG